MGFGNTFAQSGVGSPAGKGGRSSGIGMPQQSINPMQTTSGNNMQPLMSGAQLYFQQNPDVAQSFQENNYGMDQDQFAQTHYQKYGQAEGRAYPTVSSQPRFGQPNVYANRGPWDNAQFSGPRMGGKGKGM